MSFRYKSYTESFDDEKGHEYHFKVECQKCKSTHDITVKGPDLFRYNQGAFVQDAFPYLSPEDRELLISGMCDGCWRHLTTFANQEEF